MQSAGALGWAEVNNLVNVDLGSVSGHIFIVHRVMSSNQFALRAASRYDHVFKIILVGDGDIGKTALFSKFRGNDEFVSKYVATIGVDYAVTTFEHRGHSLKFQMVSRLRRGSGRRGIEIPRGRNSCAYSGVGILFVNQLPLVRH